MRSFSSSLVSWARGRSSLFLMLLAMGSTFWSLRSTAAEPEPKEQPYVLESYYKVRWGKADEFIRLFKKNHLPVLKKLAADGRILKISPGARQLVRRFRDQAALRTGSGNARSGRAPSRRQASSSPFRRAASSAAKASTPCGDQLIPWCLQRADTAQSLYFSTRVLAIHNPARCRCW